jgi:peptidylprolyl isomerase
MAKAKSGDKVKVSYTGRLDDGTVFDSFPHEKPLEFTLGHGQTLRGFEEAILGMEEGESKTMKIPSDKAYGPHLEQRMMSVAREKVPADLKLETGKRLQVRRTDGRAIPVTVAEISSSHVLLDANHPLAGKDLTFSIELVKIL